MTTQPRHRTTRYRASRPIGNHTRRTTGTQRGMALAMSLIFLLILTLFAVVSMNTGTLQEKMAGNMRDLDISLQSAESAFFSAQSDINTLSLANGGKVPPCMGVINGFWCVNTTDWKNPDWWNTNGMEYRGLGKQITEAYEDPRYLFEDTSLPTSMKYCYTTDTSGTSGSQCSQYTRVHTRGRGATGIAESILHGFTENTTTK